MGEMTPRERVETTLRHEEPDRVPLDIGGGNSTSLLVETYENLKEHLGKSAPTRIMNKAFRSAELDEDVMVRLGSDVRSVRTKAPRNWTPPPSEPNTFIDGFSIKWRQTHYPGGYYWEIIEPPLAEATVSDLEGYPWPDPDDPGRYEGLKEEVRDLYENTNYALMGDSVIKGFWEPMFMLRGVEQSLMDVVINKDFVHALMEKLFELNTAVTRRFLEITGPYLSVFRMADDMATQETLLMSPATYREMIKPYHQRFNTFLKEYTDAKIFYHSCGNVVPLLDELIDAGFEILNPVQVAAFKDPADVKSKYGEKLTFWGGIDTQRVMPKGTPDEVREEVQLRIRQFGPGGGFVAAAVHNMQPDIPPQNIVAMSEAVRALGKYPINGKTS